MRVNQGVNAASSITQKTAVKTAIEVGQMKIPLASLTATSLKQ